MVVAVLICIMLRQAAAEPSVVSTYHGNAARSGNYVVPGLTAERAATMHIDPSFDGAVEGLVMAQPLYWRPDGAAHGMLIVATEADTVAALDAVTGRTVWRMALGTPVPLGLLACGNIDPVGITGTPVIDPASSLLYVAALVNDGGTLRHRVFALRLTDGAVVQGWPVDVEASLAARGIQLSARLENQRGALGLADHRLYVPFGGNWGDCGAYHGAVVGIDTATPGVFGAWVTRARKAGIWAPGGVVSDGRSLFVTTGNAAPEDEWNDQEAVFRLAPDLRRSSDPHDFFAPSDWRRLDETDADLGGANPIPIDVPTPQGAREFLLQLGKDGNAYLLDRANLGGIGGAVLVQPVARSTIITAPAAVTTDAGTIVVFATPDAECPHGGTAGLAALLVTAAPSVGVRSLWCAQLNALRPAPVITTTDGRSDPIVWVAGGSGDQRLHAFRADTGQAVFADGAAPGRMRGLDHFATVLPVEDTLYVGGRERVFAFRAGSAEAH